MYFCSWSGYRIRDYNPSASIVHNSLAGITNNKIVHSQKNNANNGR